MKDVQAMKNVEVRIEGNKLILEVDLTKEFGPSSSGKTIIVASSEGNAPVPDHPGIQMGLNVFKKA